MTTLQQKIIDTFLARLAETKSADMEQIAQLKELLAHEKKLKPEDLVRLFSLPILERIND